MPFPSALPFPCAQGSPPVDSLCPSLVPFPLFVPRGATSAREQLDQLAAELKEKQALAKEAAKIVKCVGSCA